jgi:hypothetical protein
VTPVVWGECGSRGRGLVTFAPGRLRETPGRHDDRSASSSLDWDRSASAECRKHGHVPGSASEAERRRWFAAASAAVERRQAGAPPPTPPPQAGEGKEVKARSRIRFDAER